MFKLNKIISAVAVCTAMIITTTAIAKPEQGHRHHDMKKLFSQLSISDTQKQDIKQIMQQARGDRDVSKADVKSFKQDLKALVQASDWNQEAVEALLSEHQVNVSKANLRKAQNKHAVWNVLTAEQQSELAALIAEKKEQSAEGLNKRQSKGAKKGHKKGKHSGKRGHKLGLDEQQTAAIQAIKAQTKLEAEGLKENLKAFKQAERALISSSDFNDEKWTELHQQHQADFLAMAVLQEKTKHQMWNVLTPEQQEKMQKMKGKQKGKHAGKKKMKRKQQES